MRLKTFISIGVGTSVVAALTSIIVASSIVTKKSELGTKISKFENLIDVTGVPYNYDDTNYEARIAPFSDLGSWHSMSLPGYANRKYWGGFTQPLIIKRTSPHPLAKSLDQLDLYEYELDRYAMSKKNALKDKEGKTIPIVKTNANGYKLKLINFRALPKEKVFIKQYPGGLWQEFKMGDLTLQLNLRFTHQRTSTVKYNIINNSSSQRAFKLSWRGKIFPGATQNLGARFEKVATINSHPYIENKYGQPLMFDSNDPNDRGSLKYVVRNSNKEWEFVTNANDVLNANFAHTAKTSNGLKMFLLTPVNINNFRFSHTFQFKNRYLSNEMQNLNHPDNIIKNAISLKMSKFDFNGTWGGNWLGHQNDWKWQMVFPNNRELNTNISDSSYNASLKKPLFVKANASTSMYVSTTFSFTAQEREGFQYENHGDVIGDKILGSYSDEVKNDMLNSKNVEKSFKRSIDRWKYYLDNLIGNDSNNNFTYQKVAVKGMESLITNWRGSSGMLEHQGITPSMSIKWFNSFWSWDSWKQAVAAVNFDPKLAMDNVKVLYDFQVVDDPSEDIKYHFDLNRRKSDIGMIPDLVDYVQENTNWRDTKPPLSGWAIYNIYKVVKDRMADKIDFRTGNKLMDEVKEFLSYMYIRLMAYHAWWYQNRDADGNGINEYGATVDDGHVADWQGNHSQKAITTSVAWESGMDNAPRFDINGAGPKDPGLEFFVNKNADKSIASFVLQQESVDLNSYMYFEKQFIIKIANALKEMGVDYNKLPGVDKSTKLHKFLFQPMKDGLSKRLKGKAKSEKIMFDIGFSYKRDIAQMEKDSQYLKNYINTKMFDKDSGFFYDLRYEVDNMGIRKPKDFILSNRGKGPEGFIPLFTNVSSKKNASDVRDVIMDTHGFNTHMPFPTVSWDNDKFEPDQYWRGPVWLDQAYFGVRGLSNYGFEDDASYMALKLFNNAKGLLDGGPIRENYNPITGEGLNAKGFSWSSGMYLLMYTQYIREE